MKRIGMMLLILVAMLGFTINQVQAGGWSAVSLLHLPRSIEVGQSIDFEYRVLQHGIHSIPDLDTSIETKHIESGEELVVEGHYDPDEEVYVAQANFPQSGEWQWSIVAFEGVHPMPPLDISPNPQAKTLSWWQLWLEDVFGRKPVAQEGLTITEMFSTDEDYGAALFVSKGCSGCHVHSDNPYAVPEDSYGYIGAYQTGPDLSEFTSSSEYLQLWLSDPLAVKPDTGMPDLDLSDEEVQALISFLNAD